MQRIGPGMIQRSLVVWATLAFVLTPTAHAADAVWTHVSRLGDPATPTERGWVVYDSRRDRFIHHPGTYWDEWYRAFEDSVPTYAIRPDAWTCWSKIASDELLTPRDDVAAVYDSVDDCVLTFGGTNSMTTPSEFGDLFRLRLSDSAPGYRLVSTTGPAPPPRHQAGLAIDTKRHRLLLFGGRNGSGVLNDFWALSLDDPQSWQRISVPGPPARTAHATVYDPVADQLWVLCGEVGTGTTLADVWTFDFQTSLWSPRSLTGNAPAGPIAAVFDTPGQRLMAVSSAAPPQVRVLPSGSSDWILLQTDLVGPPRTLAMFSVPLQIAWKPSPASLLVMGKLTAFDPYDWDNKNLDPMLLRFPPLPRIAMTTSNPVAEYWYGFTTVHWTMPTDRPLVERAEVWSGSNRVWTAFPDSLGRFAFGGPGSHDDRGQTVPDTSYVYRLRWFDGTAMRDTGDFILRTQPYPQDIGFAADSLVLRPSDFLLWMSTADDSARWLVPQTFERRIPPGDWQVMVSSVHGNLEVWREWRECPDSLYEYRMTWGRPSDPRSSQTIQVRPPRPRFVSSTVSSRFVDLRWAIQTKSLFHAFVRRVPIGDPGISGSFGPVDARSDGSISFRDTTVTPEARYLYKMVWYLGSSVCEGEEIFIDVPADTTTPPPPPPPPPPPVQLATGLAGIVNPATGQLQFTVQVASTDRAQITVLDLAGRVLWRGDYGPGEHPVVVRGNGWAPGAYFVRLKGSAIDVTKRVVLIE